MATIFVRLSKGMKMLSPPRVMIVKGMIPSSQGYKELLKTMKLLANDILEPNNLSEANERTKNIVNIENTINELTSDT